MRSGARSVEHVRRDAEASPDARTVTERGAATGTGGTRPRTERRGRPGGAENPPAGGTPKVRGEARASGRPAHPDDAGRADDITRDSGRPRSRPAARPEGTAQQPGGVGAALSALARRAGAAWQDFAHGGGAIRAAVAAAVQAFVAGRNPVVAAIKGWFGALSTPMKFLVITGLVLLAILAPVLLLLLLLALAVAVVVIGVRTPAAG